MLDKRGKWERTEKRRTVDEYLRLDVGQVARTLPLDRTVKVAWPWNFTDGTQQTIDIITLPALGLHLAYNHGDQAVDPYIVKIVYTLPHLGGKRPWFLCPHCGRRVRMLYGGRYFLCRECHGLTYESRQRTRPRKTWEPFWLGI